MNDSDFFDLYVCVRDALDKAPPRGPQGIASTKDLQKLVEERTRIRVVWRFVDGVDLTQLRGLLVRYKDASPDAPALGTTAIYIPSQLNYCWRRLVQLKELMHLLLDEEHDYTQDPTGLLNGLLLGNSATGSRAAVESEKRALIAALLYALPFKFRPQWRTGTPLATEDIAKQFRIPKFFVQQFYSTHLARNSDAFESLL